MPRAATDVMQSIMFSAILDAIAALKSASGGLPNNLLRDVQAIHGNVTFADLPKELQDAVANSVRGAFTALLKEGYAVAPSSGVPATRSPVRRGEEVARGQTRPARPPASSNRRPDGAPPRGPRSPCGPGGGPGGPKSRP
jgi:hypothetical protein